MDFIIPSAMAYDTDPSIPGLIHCRPQNHPQDAGYFKAYFEDIADNTNAGYDEDSSNLGANRVSDVCNVLEEIANIIKINEVGGATPEILFTKTWPADAPPLALASAGSFMGPVTSSSPTYSGYLHEHILKRVDPSSGPDALVNTNWNSNILWSVDSSLNSTTFDFKTVMRHEIFHALGFTTFLPAVTQSMNVQSQHNHWDRNLFAPNSPGIVDCTNSQACTPYLTPTFTPLLQIPVGAPSSWFINNASIYQGRKNYVNASLDGSRPLFTPTSWMQGSSLAHFDMDRLTSLPNGLPYVMHPSINPGIARNIHEHEKEVLCHLGYQVRDMSGCELRTPVAVGDEGTINGISVDVPLLQNDDPTNSGITNLGVHSIQYYFNASTITFFNGISTNGLNCTGSSIDSGSGSTFLPPYTYPYTYLITAPFLVKCIRFSAPSSLSILNFKYKIKDQVSNRISDIANVLYSRCNAVLGEHVCNGNFEMGTTGMSPTFAFGGSVPFWGHAYSNAQNTPDLVVKNWGFTGQYNYAPFTTWFGLAFDLVDNGNFASSFWVVNSDSNEKIATKFKSPLVPGQCYKISFDAALIATNGTYNSITQHKILGGFSTEELRADYTYEPNVLNNAFNIINQNLSVSTGSTVQWINISKNFSPSDAYEYLAIHMPNPTTIPYGGFSMVGYVDNVSVKKIDSSLCSSHSISGSIYNDVNLNGQMDLGEPVYSTVKVRLYNSQGALVNETTSNSSGIYKFYGLTPAQEYMAVIKHENLFQTITEPPQNSNLNGFQHTRTIAFNNGGAVTGENFGVILQGQSLVAPIIVTSTRNCNNHVLSVSSLGAGYTYNWSGPNFTSTSPSPTVTNPGVYTVVVNGPNGYVNSGSITLASSQFAQLSGVINSSSTNISIITTLTGTTANSYSWSGPNNFTSTQANATGISSPGTYTLAANYGDNCTIQASFIVQASCAEAPPTTNFNTSLTSTNNVPILQCYLATYPNGTSECLYNVANPAGLNWYNGCPSTVAGTNCCGWTNACGGGSSGLPATIINATTSPSSNGSNGSIILNVTGQGPFTYLWNNGATTQNLINLAPGTYSVTVKNTNGCPTQANFTVLNPIQTTLVQGFTCPANNSITATVNGGTAPLTFRWYKNGVMYPSTTSPYNGLNPSNLAAGNYYLNVTDATGQSVQSQTITIQAYTAPTVAALKTDATMPAYNNGTINVTVSGGLSPFNYFFSGLNAMTTGPIPTNPYLRTGLIGNNDAPATYGIFVIDARNCQSNTISGIKILKKLTATSFVVTDCSSGTKRPMIVITPAGGHGTYTYQWKQGTTILSNTSASLIGSAAGTYTVTVKDQSLPTQQSVTLTVTMPSTAPSIQTSVAVVNATNGQSNGSATITTTAGMGPYTYTYSPGTSYAGIISNSHNRTGLAAGIYNVEVKNNYSCIMQKSFTIQNTITATNGTLLKQ